MPKTAIKFPCLMPRLSLPNDSYPNPDAEIVLVASAGTCTTKTTKTNTEAYGTT